MNPNTINLLSMIKDNKVIFVSSDPDLEVTELAKRKNYDFYFDELVENGYIKNYSKEVVENNFLKPTMLIYHIENVKIECDLNEQK